jgi:hypothetical protein
MKRAILFFLVLATVGAVLSCGEKPDQAGTKYDSLFLGIYLGMEKQTFYDHCWEYNRRKIFTHGPTNQNVEYRLTAGLNSPVVMRFYPIFYQDRIFEMPVTFSYDSWAPWNRQFKSDSLIKQLVPLYEKWYGKFKVTDHPEMGRVYYRMDGKRRINLYLKDDQFVRAVYTDLKMEKELNEKAEQASQNDREP